VAKKADLTDTSRCYLYSSDCPQGEVFQGADAIAAAKKSGWKDKPPKVKPSDGGDAEDAS
jgi:hypothetical protein